VLCRLRAVIPETPVIVPCQTCRQEFLVQVLVTNEDKADNTTIPINISLPDLDNLASNQISGELFSLLAIGLPLLRTIDSSKADLDLCAVLKDFDGVTIGDAYDLGFP